MLDNYAHLFQEVQSLLGKRKSIPPLKCEMRCVVFHAVLPHSIPQSATKLPSPLDAASVSSRHFPFVCDARSHPRAPQGQAAGSRAFCARTLVDCAGPQAVDNEAQGAYSGASLTCTGMGG